MEFAPQTHGGMVEEDERENALGYRQRAPEAKLPHWGISPACLAANLRRVRWRKTAVEDKIGGISETSFNWGEMKYFFYFCKGGINDEQ
jgi:hypothetical protein